MVPAMDFDFWAPSFRMILCGLDRDYKLTDYRHITAPLDILELIRVWKSVWNTPSESYWYEKAT